MEQLGRVVEEGDTVDRKGVKAEVVESDHARATRVRLIVQKRTGE